jgi:hypothetical protein
MKKHFVLFAAILFSTANSRDNYTPMENRPLSMVINGNILFNSGVNLDYRMLPAHSIIKYDFITKTMEIITDTNISTHVNSLADSKQYLFAGGTEGLSVCDKITGKWEKWLKDTINTIVAKDDKIWLGTMNGVKEIDIRNKKTRIFNSKRGLNQNKIFSLYLFNDTTLFVGTYRNGKGTRNERQADMYSTGLNKIDLSTSIIKNVELPPAEKRHADIVLDMYPVTGDTNRVRIVMGCWSVTIFDYNPGDGSIRHKPDRYHHIEGILAKAGRDIKSPFVDTLLEYFIGTGLNKFPAYGIPNPIALEIVDILYKKNNFPALEKLFLSNDVQTRALSIWALSPINTPWVNDHLIHALGDTSDWVTENAARILCDRRDKDSIIRP